MQQKPKSYYAKRADAEMADNLEQSDLTVQQQLTVTSRMMALEGHDAGGAGQITAKAEEEGTFWTLRFGRGFDETTPASFIRVDEDLKTVEGEGFANPAARFHLWVYKARPDVNCIVHAHPPWISALSMLGQPLIVAHMDQTPFYDDCAYLADWPGLPIADDEGAIISKALGEKSSIILAHHGYLTAASTVSEACFLGIYLERAARMQVRAASAGTITPVDAALATESRDFFKSSSVIETTFAYYARQVAAHYGNGCLA